MEKEATTIIISTLTALLSGGIAYYFTLKREEYKKKIEIERQQNHDFFQPFKYASKEFGARLQHIESKLNQRDKAFTERFSPHVEVFNRPKYWYFQSQTMDTDGGYFIASTIYMNCILFNRMKKIQEEHPFIPLRFKRQSDKRLYNTNPQITRCLRAWHNELNMARLDFQALRAKDRINIDEIVEYIRVPLALYNGIPYGLHDSFGDFIKREDGSIMNYEEFVEELIDEDKAVKFQPIVRFWTNITNQYEVDDIRLDKIRKLIVILHLVQFGDVR